MHNKSFVLILILIIPFSLAAQDSGQRLSPEEYESSLLLDGSKNDEQRRLDYIEAAEIKQLTGDLKGAAVLFKKASLTVKGKKDFISLYRATVLNIEMAFFREAEADLRAILTFSNDAELRIKSTILSARLKKNDGAADEARAIMISIFSSSEPIPNEAFHFASEIFDDAEFSELCSHASANGWSDRYLKLKPLITPEIVFGKYNGGFIIAEPADALSEESSNSEALAASIQLGSFSVRENAEDLQKTVNESGWAAEVRNKTVNDREYFTVVVPISKGKAVQQIIIELKEKGFEGYPVY